jgi:hypothetical protein
MKTFSVTTSIRATPDSIWTLLTQSAQYPGWNPTIEKIDGRIAAGEKLTVHPKVNPSGRTFPVTVTEFDPPKSMTWTGGMPLGLFKGVRTFRLTPHGTGETEFAMEEVYSGLLAPLIGKSIPDLQPAFDAFAAALKTRAEQGAENMTCF